MSKSIQQIEEEIVQEFNMFDDPMMRYEYLIDIGKKLLPIDESLKTEERVVKGCQSTVWLHSFPEDGKVIYRADSNTIITKGIVGLLVRLFSGQKPEDIIDYELQVIDRIQLRSHLSEQRSSGLNAMVRQMKLDALVFQKQIENQQK